MTLLTQQEILDADIVTGDERGERSGWRATSHDSRVGKIVTRRGEFTEDVYFLKPRSIVWLISKEVYTLPKHITGITTLKTGLTKSGLLTLTAGIVDPGYSGPISTAVINFSQKNFAISRGDPFFRTVFFKHPATSEAKTPVTKEQYVADVIANTTNFSDTFLTLDTLANDLAKKLFILPKVGVWIAIIGVWFAIFVASLQLFVPPLSTIADEIKAKNAELTVLRQQVLTLREEVGMNASQRYVIDGRLSALERTIESEAGRNLQDPRDSTE